MENRCVQLCGVIRVHNSLLLPCPVFQLPACAIHSIQMRVCKYVVMGEYDRNLIDPMPDRLHTAEGVPCAVDDSDDNSWDCDDQ